MATGEGGGAVPGSGGLGEGGGAMDEARDELDRWRRAWSVVVRRDILRQQRAVVTSHKEMLVMLKRTAIATQKEVRKRALRAQRLSSNPENQLRCKKLARDVTNLAAQLEAAQDDRLVAAEKAAFLRRRQLGISSASGAADATSRRQLGLPSASGATYRSSAVSAVGAAGGSTWPITCGR